ncbi:serine hydroxymethyltransferase [Pantoea ananatis]|uniref:serine hydroxymethyltransferase n=1 Tax=Pantoea ananas TaxID=553 RepID=UPI0002418375|nr:serine hydroxymethyltransferase [Pantoea ananatis]CCF09980.1 serine hydroxymethyltransferase [Pantoea ananatis LMG 5342]
MSKKNLDDYIDNLLVQEKIRQDNNITFIASEWAMMAPVRKALSSIFAEKYFEGTPVDRSYNILREKGLIDRELIALKKPGWFSPGCNIYDDLSWLCQSTLLDLFDPEKLSNYYVDNRVLSGSQANQAVFLSIMKKKRKKELKILSLDLIHGGHLSHGIKNSLIGILHEIIPYHVNETTETVDYQELEIIALNHNPDLIIYGGSSCPRDWDHNKMMSIVSKLPESNLLFDGSHPAGLIAAGLNNNPFHAGVHFITMTTNKTLCGARGAFVACLPQWAEVLSKAVFPGLTAGPHGHEMYAKLIGYRCAKKITLLS